jgi:hypothetical protein
MHVFKHKYGRFSVKEIHVFAIALALGVLYQRVPRLLDGRLYFEELAELIIALLVRDLSIWTHILILLAW